MEPLALSNAFATIVGLLVDFKSERSDATLSEFMSWLREQHQEQVAQSIARDKALATELTSLLRVNHGDLVAHLASINKQISMMSRKVDDLSAYAKTQSRSAEISNQAKSVLRQIVSSGSNLIIENENNAGQMVYLCGGGSIDCIQFDEPLFIKEDFNHLLKLGFLKIERYSGSARFFVPTRAGVHFVADLPDA
jgi:hypothetical protein